MRLRMRPRFVLHVALPPEAVLARLREASWSGALPCRVTLLDGLAELAPRRVEKRVWSPYLKLVVDPAEVPPDAQMSQAQAPDAQVPDAPQAPDALQAPLRAPQPQQAAARLDGRFGPNANLWTFFVALYAIAGILGGIALLWAYSQTLLGNAPTALWGTLAAAIMALLVWIAAQVGQHCAEGQMQMLYDAVHDTVADALLDGDEPPTPAAG